MHERNTDSKSADREWARKQIATFRSRLGDYEGFARVLKAVLEQVARKLAPQAIVQTRPKSIASFADKIYRKRAGHKDPVNQFTDLCGGRVIVHTPEEVKAISKFIEDHFIIDWDNSVDVSQRHKPTEFGYRSVHYIVSFKRRAFPNAWADVKVPRFLLDMKNPRAEIQVRTLLEHAWADISHDLVYKCGFKIPSGLERELAAVAALLENADSSFSRIVTALRTYASSYGVYMTPGRMRQQIELLEFVLGHDRENVQLASKLGQLAISLGDWELAVRVLGKHTRSGHTVVLRDLGRSLCKLHAQNPRGRDYRQGQRFLEKAASGAEPDRDAIAMLAGTWRRVDTEKARQLYLRAYEMDPTDCYALGNHLDAEIEARKDVSIVQLMTPVILASINRCRQQARVGINLPYAFYAMGKFYLYMERPYESLVAYAKALQLSSAPFMIESPLRSIEGLKPIRDTLAGYNWVHTLLLAGLAAKFPTDARRKALKELASTKPIEPPIVIVAGGCDPAFEQEMSSYRDLVIGAFRDYTGTVISGGTIEGISGFVGDLAEKYRGSIRTLSYLPKMIPSDATLDRRYDEIRRTEGSGFSPLEPLQNWVDIISAGIYPATVKVLGINGGSISAVEYRLALALGAKVGIVEDSGREAAKLWPDEDWGSAEGLAKLPKDPMTLRAFIGTGEPRWKEDERKAVAQAIHQEYRMNRMKREIEADTAMAPWGALREELVRSNLQQADHVFEKLGEIGCTLVKISGRKIKLLRFTGDEVEKMAEMEHGRWNAERLLDGWSWAPDRDPLKKTSPYLVAWADLPEDVREWDRATVRKIPEFLANIGYEVRRGRRR
ncbi:MAG: RyR domain-containing protein [Acidobacteriota bacterium]